MKIENKSQMLPLAYYRNENEIDLSISHAEALERMAYKINRKIDTIKTCCVFFAILAAIGVCAAVISLIPLFTAK